MDLHADGVAAIFLGADCQQHSDNSFTVTGTQLNGLSYGGSYGDDNMDGSNYPLVRLVSSGGTVYYARTYNFSVGSC